MSNERLSEGVAPLALAPERPRRRLSERQARTVDRLAEAATAEVRRHGYDGLTVRNVARRAKVAPATAYNYFASKDHLLAEVFWRRLQGLPPTLVDRRRGPAARLNAVVRDIALLVADEPELAGACTTAMLASDPDVRHLRVRIGVEVYRRLAEALDPGADPQILRAIDLALTGALVQAGMGHLSYGELPDRLAEVVGLAFGDR